MTKHKSTKRALLLSGLALFACISMLVGSTFAWFTDSVVSKNNIITSGNLDVELYYQVEGQTDWAKVDANTNVFMKDALWEPGHTEVVKLKVVNEGTLALKYNLGVNVNSEIGSKNVLGKDFKLSDYIKYGIVEGAQTYTRDAAVAAVDAAATALKAPYNKASALKAGEEAIVTMVVYMPTTVGNEANYDKAYAQPIINLGINLFATQYTHEEDSFDKYYDGAAEWLGGIDTAWYNETATEFVIGSAEELAGLAQIVNTAKDSFAGKTVKLVSNINLNNLEWAPIGDVDADDFVGFQGTFDGQGYAIANLKIESDSWGQGLFGYSPKAFTVKNVNIHNANVKAADTCGIIAGWADLAILSNIHVTGDVSVIGTSDAAEAGHVGGIIGRGYSATIENCSVIANAGSSITSAGSFVGGIAGYQCNYTKAITGCTVKNVAITGESSVGGIAGIIASGTTFANNAVENVVLTKIRVGGYPKIGALIGCYDGSKDTALANCSVKDVTLNGSNEAYPAYNELYGAGYDAKATAKFDVDSVAVNGITNNLVEVTIVSTNDQLKNALANDATVVLGDGKFALPTLSGKEGITIIGSDDTVIGGGATGFGGNFGKNTTIKNVTFSGSTNGVRSSYAQGGDTVFENCTFAGDSTYGFHIDQSNSATFTFNNCTFSGFNAFAGDLVKVIFNNCTFLHNGNYGHTNIWSVAEFNNCTFGDKTSVGQGKDSNATIYFDGVEESYHHEYVGSADSLFAFADSVNNGADAWSGQKIVLVDDIDLNNVAWTPIGQTGATQFKGTFDGNGHTIKNLNIDSSAKTGANYSSGLFGWLNKATVKNVTVENATVIGNHNVAVIAGYMETSGCTISNCHVINATVTAKHANDDACGDKVGVIVGHAGNAGVKVENCSAKDCTVIAGRDAGQIAGAAKEANIVGCSAENVTVTAGGDCTGKNVNNAIIGRVL